MEELNIILNGKPVKGKKGQTILSLANEYGIEIPTLCHDPRLDPYSSCFVCVVEVAGMKGLQPACSTRLNEGMDIQTENDKVKKARKSALDLILSNHYADCVAPCKQTCPAGVDVQGYISLIEKGMYKEAIGLIKEVNPLPAICGRVCVRPCEVACRRNLLDEGTAVGIDYLKRFAADQDIDSGDKFMPEMAMTTGKQVAIIGAGPGGLSAAYFLQQKGHQCDIFEAAPAAGGWLRYGIPEYRLPNDLLQKEVDSITEMGANIYYNKKLGDNVSYEELNKKYDSVILTIGSQIGTLINTEGDDADGVFPGIIFLKNMEVTGQKYDFSGKTVAVVGGGNTAMDCCRTSIRCGAEKVYVVYRRTEKEMPANPIEIHESKLEGVEYLFLTNPTKVNKDAAGKVESMTLIKMELGEPDASGRRRPVPVEGSEFDLPVDYILAAIGQKTDVNFIDDINKFTDEGELKINRWGDIDADSKTLQTGIPKVFAAGDGVTGPATLIEAIAQAKIASRSCHQFLSGEEIKNDDFEFISTRDNFKTQVVEDYKGYYKEQSREEMPVLDPDARFNFDEVELGYANEDVAKHETSRCLECGCVEYYDCDLKKHATKYGAEQKKFAGDYMEYQVDFGHPYIEIDNNKCVLCSRCIRICSEVVGANALGLVNRGFNTFVAPSMGDSLTESPCESCGMCITACPTAAISENVPFKPGPVKLDTMTSVDNFGSEGFEVNYKHHNGFIMKAEGSKNGLDGLTGSIATDAKFGYKFLNDKNRITKPLIKKNGEFVEISNQEAIELMALKMKSINPDENAFFGGARLTNEELYMIQKLARAGVKTNNVHSFHYIARGKGYEYDSVDNVPFADLPNTEKIYLLGADINKNHPLVNHMVMKAKNSNGIPVELITANEESSMKRKVDGVHTIKSYFHYVRALNYYLLSNNKQNAMFLNDHTEGFEEYKEQLLAEDYNDLLEKAGGCGKECLEGIAESYNSIHKSVIIFSEKEVSPATAKEIMHLGMITGKLGKHAAGVISLKEKNNSQGIFDMGIRPGIGVGAHMIDDAEFRSRMNSVWNTNVSDKVECVRKQMEAGTVKQLFIFGEDPVGCAVDKADVEKWFATADFVVVQDYFITETAEKADLILPATLPLEMDGSYTNTQKELHQFAKQMDCKTEMTSVEMLIELQKQFELNGIGDITDVLSEAFNLLPTKEFKHTFVYNEKDNGDMPFKYGCDVVVKKVQEEMDNALN